jgi:putative transcriptional regulator
MSAEQIRELRQRLGMTQLEFANEIGTTPTSVSRWESGKVKPQGVALKALRKLAERADQA